MTKPPRHVPPIFTDAFREHRIPLYRYLRRRLANVDDAQDETFAVADLVWLEGRSGSQF